MLLEEKTAIVYGGAGSIGSAVARGLAVEGARVFLAGRTLEPLTRVAEEILASGGRAEAAVVDALDADSVDRHADAVAAASGRLDISFTAISDNDVQGTPLVEMDVEDYLAPVVNGVRTTFLTATAGARRMRDGGVILIFGGSGDPVRGYSLGGLQTAFHALEAMRRQLAAELGERGVRTVTMRSGGVPETIPEDFDGRDRIVKSLDESTLTGRSATLEDVANIAAFVASDQARTMTAATVNTSAGSLID